MVDVADRTEVLAAVAGVRARRATAVSAGAAAVGAAVHAIARVWRRGRGIWLVTVTPSRFAVIMCSILIVGVAPATCIWAMLPFDNA